jgi:hypothetical protein
MKRKTAPVLLGVAVAGAMLVIAPFILWGERPDREATSASERQQSPAVVVFAEGSPDGISFPGIVSAVERMREGIPIGSAVAVSAVYGSNVIIARRNDLWRTIPQTALFYFDESACRADVFLDQSEFTVFLKKHPELAREGIRALELSELLQVLPDEKSLIAKKAL